MCSFFGYDAARHSHRVGIHGRHADRIGRRAAVEYERVGQIGTRARPRVERQILDRFVSHGHAVEHTIDVLSRLKLDAALTAKWREPTAGGFLANG